MVLEAASLVRMYLSMAAWKSWMAWGMGVREGSRGLPGGMWVAPVGSVKIGVFSEYSEKDQPDLLGKQDLLGKDALGKDAPLARMPKQICACCEPPCAAQANMCALRAPGSR